MTYLEYVVIIFIAFGLLSGCRENSTGTDGGEQEEEEQKEYEGYFKDFDGPNYTDDYTGRASWNQRSSWNLANVHDPTVVKNGEYYYMFQTNASYGNEHQGHGNYPYRRSKDLVDWEYLGAAFQDV